MQAKVKKTAGLHMALLAALVVGLALITGAAAQTLSRTSRDNAAPVTIPAGAMISLGPTYGGAHTLVNITGMGFPNNSPIAIYIMPLGGGAGTQPYSEGLTDGEGMFSVMLPVPEHWPDGSTITAETLVVLAMSNITSERAEGGVAQAVSDFHYLPVAQQDISISPARGKAGTRVVVAASGFPPDQLVGIYLGGRDGARPLTQVYALGTTDDRGYLNQTFTVPDHWPDGAPIQDEQVEIVARTKDESVLASAGFDYEPSPQPSIAISPDAGGPGTPVHITSEGFPAGSRVLIQLGTSVDDASGRPAYAETRANLQGKVDLSFNMPGAWPEGEPIQTQDIVVLGITGDGRGYGWAWFAYLRFVTLAAEQDGSAGNDPPVPQQDRPAVQPQASSPPFHPHTAEAQPSISLDPATGRAGTVVDVTGTGFPANVPLIMRLGLPATGFDDMILGNAVTDGAGGFAAQLSMPETWSDGASIIETHLVVAVTSIDGAAMAGTDFLYVSATDQAMPALEVCDIKAGMATRLNLVPGQLETVPADVVDPSSGSVYAGCIFQFNLSGQSPMELIRTSLAGLGWQEDTAHSDDDISVFRAEAGLMVIRVGEAQCTAESQPDACPDASIHHTITIDYARASTP